MKSLNMYCKNVEIFGIRFDLISNSSDFINGGLEIKLQQKFQENARILENGLRTADFYCYIIDDDLPLKFVRGENDLLIRGNISELEKEYGEVHSILRYFIYNYMLSCLESKLGMFNIHASSVVGGHDYDKVLLFIGPSGCGKTSCMLSAVDRGYAILGNDISSIQQNNGNFIFYPTSSFSPVERRIFENFDMAKEVVIDNEKENGRYKIPIDLNSFSYRKKIINPDLTVVFPHIIDNAEVAVLSCENKRKAASRIYEQITERIRNIGLLYYALPVPSLDTEEQMVKRADFSKNLMNFAKRIVYVRGDAQKIMEEIK